MNSSWNNTLLSGVLSFILGLLTPLSFSPYSIYIIALITLACLIHLWTISEPRVALLHGYLFGLGMFGSGISWLHISINLFGGINLFTSIILTFLFVAFISLYPAITGYVYRRFFSHTSRSLALLLVVPSLWTLSEWIRSWIFTGFPWLNLGYSHTDTPLKGMAAVLGVYGIGWLAVLTAGGLAKLINSGKRQQLKICILIIFIWTGCWLLHQQNWTVRSIDELSIALVQGSVPQELKWRPEMRQTTVDLYKELSRPVLDYDLIIWPEAAIPAFYHQLEGMINELEAITRHNDNRIMVGLPVLNPNTGEHYNSLISIDNRVTYYHKRHLVPFGEYLPLKFLLEDLTHFLNIPISDFSAGNDLAPVIINTDYNIGVSICYEDTFGEELIQAIPDANILVNVSNDAWFGDSAAPHQHLQMARMRALETGRYLLRATNTGISAIIDEKGKIIDQLPQFTPATLTGKAQLFDGYTPYARYGNFPVIIISILLLVITALADSKRKEILTG